MGGRKRSREDFEEQSKTTNQFGMGQTLSKLRETGSASPDALDTEQSSASQADGRDDWKKVETSHSIKKQKSSKEKTSNYPAIVHSASARLQTHVKIGDLQALVLYVLADGTAPQWVSVRHHGSIRKVVVLMVPGLEVGMFDGTISLETASLDKAPISTGGKNPTDPAEASPELIESHVLQRPSSRMHLSPDDYYPVRLTSDLLSSPLKPIAGIFSHLWPIKTPGDEKYSRIHSPLHAMLTAQLPKSKEEKKGKGPVPPREEKNWHNKRTPITEYLATREQLLENEYILHPAMFDSREEMDREFAKLPPGDVWKDTRVDKLEDGDVPDSELQKGSLVAGREILAMDCEMCKTEGDTFELTRISLVGWDGSVIYDQLVKPEKPIIDYLTQYSGMTKEILEPVTTKLSDVQKYLLDKITPRTILVGHSLNSDLTALKLRHPFIIDTSIIYPHPRGPPLKSSLKWLAQKYLGREIQKHHGTTGHDSVEDARACLDLVKQKCERGPRWGTSDATGEPIFKRLARASKPVKHSINGTTEGRTGGVVDWGDPRRGHGSSAEVCIGCGNDAQVVEGVRKAVNGDSEGKVGPNGGVDFVWARLRELEAVRGWWNRSKTADNAELRANALAQDPVSGNSTEDTEAKSIALGEAVAKTIKHIQEIYDSLPPCTAFIVYSGTGDPRETARLQALQQQFKKEYQTKKWDQLSVKWTDVEEQALKKACKKAREGVGFITVK